MSLFRPRNVREESYIIFFLKGLLGLRPVGCCKRIPGFLYIFILISGYVFLFLYIAEYASLFFQNLSTYSTSSKFRNLDTTFNFIFVPIFIIIGIAMSRSIDRIFESIIEIDRQFLYLNGRFDYFENFCREFIHVFSLFFVISVISAADYQGLRNANINRAFVFLSIINFIPRIIEVIVSCSFVTLLAKIRARFSKLNDLICTAGASAKFGAVSRLDVASRVLQFRKLYSDLSAVSHDVNETYGYQLSLSIMTILVRSCGHLSVVPKNYDDENQLVDTILSMTWAIFEIGLLLYITKACQEVKNESEKSLDLLTHRNEFREIQSNHPIMTSDKVKFRLFHMFVIDYQFFGVIIIGLLGYVFIIAKTSLNDK